MTNMKEYLQNKKISIIVPIYNTDREQLLKCVDSLTFQTYSDLEILLINDGSDIYIENLCKKIAQRDERIKYYKKNNGGVSSARNFGVTKATGNYIMFIDADDWIEEKCCESIGKYIQDDYDIIAFSYIKEYENHSERVKIFEYDIINGQMNNKENLYVMSILGTSWMKLYKRDVIKNITFDETLKNAEDVEYNFRVFENVNKFCFINKNYYHYRIQTKSSVRKFNKNMIENYENTINKINNTIARSNNTNSENAYYSFLAITYLMICLNYIFNSENEEKNKRKILKNISNKNYFKKLFKNIKKVKLPITRKLPIYFGKYKMYFLVFLVVRIKQRMDER